ncbi:hypothetical protein [Kitasatospora sp. NPDC005748]|uniref:hypothetical protein n=1 Tax=Kitasatospora sp. NPDC005748 TaxID=3157063 RepID=UPI0033FB96DE
MTASAVCGPHRHGRPDRSGALRRQPDFRNYALGQKISVAGSEVTPEIGTSFGPVPPYMEHDPRLIGG